MKGYRFVLCLLHADLGVIQQKKNQLVMRKIELTQLEVSCQHIRETPLSKLVLL